MREGTPRLGAPRAPPAADHYRPRRRRVALALALVSLSLPGCARRARAPRARGGGEPSFAQIVDVDYARLVAQLPPSSWLAPRVLTLEPPERARPNAPPGCALDGPPYALQLPPRARTVFATAVGPDGPLLSVAGGAGSAKITPDSATWLIAADGALFWLRGPVEPEATDARAADSAGQYLVAWSRPGGARTPEDGVVRLARLSRRDPAPELHTLAVNASPAVRDLACTDALCVLAYLRRDHAGVLRSAFALVYPTLEGDPVQTVRPAPDYLATHALAQVESPIVGAAQRDGAAYLVDRRYGQLPHALAAQPLALAPVAGALHAVVASAPSDAPCQPGAWRLELVRVADDGSTSDPVLLARVDARPRAVRLSPAGETGGVLVTWLDAPGCSEDAVTLRAWRAGRSVPVAHADDYDVAARGGALSLVLRRGERVHWLRARCL